MSMHVAIVLSEFPVLSETFVIRQISGLLEAGYRVTIIPATWGDRTCGHARYQFHRMETLVRPIREGLGSRAAQAKLLLRFLARAPWSFAGRRQLAAQAAAVLQGSRASVVDIAAVSGRPLGDFDVVIAHFGPAGVRAMNLQRAGLLGGPLAVVFHGYDMSDRLTLRKHRRGYQELFEHAAKLLPISDLWKQRLCEWGASSSKVRVLRMGVDLDAFPPLHADRPLNEPLRVLSVARFTEKKGLAYAVEGVAGASGPIQYDLVGGGVLEGELRELASKAPDGVDIVFRGSRSQQEVFQFLAQCDVFLLPSVTASTGDMEGIPVALMEAMATGAIVIATEHSGTPELVSDGISGYLVPERDAQAISTKIEELRSMPDRLPQLRRAARKVLEDRFNNAKIDRELLEVCEEMASGGRLHESRTPAGTLRVPEF